MMTVRSIGFRVATALCLWAVVLFCSGGRAGAQTPAPAGLEVVYPQDKPEVLEMVKRLRKQPSVKALRLRKVEYVSSFDAAVAPMNHGGRVTPLEGAHANRVVVGRAPPIMLWGPYADLEAGRYLIVYRLKVLAKPDKPTRLFLDVAHKGGTIASLRPPVDQMTLGEWAEFPVELELPKTRPLEFRFWPEGCEVAVDRIYALRVTPR